MSPASKTTIRRPAKKSIAVRKNSVQTTSAPKPYTNAQVLEILELARGSGSMELKLSVPDVSHRAAIKGLGLDPVEAEPRQAYFFDTPDLALNRAGVVVRARRIQGGGADTVIKLRPVDPKTVDVELRRSASFKVEVDAMPGGYVCSASYKGVCTGEEVLNVAAGTLPLASLFSKEQRAFYDAHAPAGVSLDALQTMGPLFLLRAKHQPKTFAHRVVVEMWLYPDGSRILEISTKCKPQEAFQAGAEFKAYIESCGIPVTAEQQAKTKTALEFFAEHAAAPARRR
jgi:hypothetical protein